MKTSNNPQPLLEEKIFLHQVKLFQDLSPNDLEELDKRMPPKKIAAGTVIYTPQQPAEVLFLLKQGSVCLYRLSAEGKQFTTATVEEGTFFGEMTLLGQSLYGSFAQASNDCLLCILDRQEVQMLLQDARITYRLIEAMGQRLVETENRLAGFVFGTATARLAALLLQEARAPRPLFSHANVPAQVNCTHEELARSVGVYRETVTKILNEWRGQGLVELGRGRVVLLETEKLRHLCAE